jgi:hypothetical protein
MPACRVIQSPLWYGPKLDLLQSMGTSPASLHYRVEDHGHFRFHEKSFSGPPTKAFPLEVPNLEIPQGPLGNATSPHTLSLPKTPFSLIAPLNERPITKLNPHKTI